VITGFYEYLLLYVGGFYVFCACVSTVYLIVILGLVKCTLLAAVFAYFLGTPVILSLSHTSGIVLEELTEQKRQRGIESSDDEDDVEDDVPLPSKADIERMLVEKRKEVCVSVLVCLCVYLCGCVCMYVCVCVFAVSFFFFFSTISLPLPLFFPLPATHSPSPPLPLSIILTFVVALLLLYIRKSVASTWMDERFSADHERGLKHCRTKNTYPRGVA
jgi:hypothetical protein